MERWQQRDRLEPLDRGVMSFETPGDGVRCDHCNRHKGQSQDGTLYANRGERLCDRCLQASVTADLNEPVGWAQVPASRYITPRRA